MLTATEITCRKVSHQGADWLAKLTGDKAIDERALTTLA